MAVQGLTQQAQIGVAVFVGVVLCLALPQHILIQSVLAHHLRCGVEQREGHHMAIARRIRIGYVDALSVTSGQDTSALHIRRVIHRFPVDLRRQRLPVGHFGNPLRRDGQFDPVSIPGEGMGKGIQDLFHGVLHIQMGFRLAHVHHQGLALGFGVKLIGCQRRRRSCQPPFRFTIGSVVRLGVVSQFLTDCSFTGSQKGPQLHIFTPDSGRTNRRAHV